jgi:DNA-binding NtrC family response regulator
MRSRVFIFEDDDTLRSLLTSLLESQGYEVMSFSEPGFCPLYSERECQCPLEHPCADVIISDLNMPNVTGLEFLENRSQHGCRVKCRALMSGGWTAAEIGRAERLGARIFEKPFKLEEILGWLEECHKQVAPRRRLSDLSDLDLGPQTKRKAERKNTAL